MGKAATATRRRTRPARPVKPNTNKLLRVYRSGQHDKLSEALLDTLRGIAKYTRSMRPIASQSELDTFAALLLHLLGQNDYKIDPRYGSAFVRRQPVITNLVAASKFANTDPAIRHLTSRGPADAPKLLALYNPRSSVRIDPKVFFDADPNLASLWYDTYFASVESYADPQVYSNLREHLGYLDDRMVFKPGTTCCYFKCTYIDSLRQRALKEKINTSIRGRLTEQQERIRNRPNPRKIAVVTALWNPECSVYRSIQPLVATLRGNYHLTLVRLGKRGRNAELGLFDEVLDVKFDSVTDLNISAVAQNDFQVVFYPEVGMSVESRFLSNLRLAPIQAVGYGHPASTFSSQMDYFIGGAEAEIAADAAENYSERLVLLPGLGAHPVWPQYKRKSPRRGGKTIIVNCPWTPMKVNYPLLEALREVVRKTSRRVIFRCYPGPIPHVNAAFEPFCKDLENVIGEGNVEVMPNLTPHQYMERMEIGDLSIDSHPFGGYNSVVDSLYLGKPLVTWEGTKFYNRAASALLRRFALDELVASNGDEYTERIVRLVDDEDYRRDIAHRIEQLDLQGGLYGSGEDEYFKRAIDFLIANHDRLQSEDSREAIYIR